MMRKLLRPTGSLLAVFVLTVSVSAPAAGTKGEDVVHQVRAAYYDLTRQGFHGFNAALDPNWEVILGPTATRENLKIFRALRFSMSVDEKGIVTVVHDPISTRNPQLESYINQIHFNIQRLVSAVFGTWAMFMVNGPLPDNESQIKLENLTKGYRLFYTRQSASVMLTMTSDLVITEVKLTDPTASRMVKPRFQKTTEGLVLNGYQMLFEPLGEGIKTTLDVTIENRLVSKMKLPSKIQFKGMYGSEPVEAEVSFKNYKVRTS
jgi:hypothetical protein